MCDADVWYSMKHSSVLGGRDDGPHNFVLPSPESDNQTPNKSCLFRYTSRSVSISKPTTIEMGRATRVHGQAAPPHRRVEYPAIVSISNPHPRVFCLGGARIGDGQGQGQGGAGQVMFLQALGSPGTPAQERKDEPLATPGNPGVAPLPCIIASPSILRIHRVRIFLGRYDA